MYVAFVLMLEAVIFYVLYAQMPTSLNFFAIYNVHHTIMGIDVHPVSFQALNPFWIIVLSRFWLTSTARWAHVAKTSPCG